MTHGINESFTLNRFFLLFIPDFLFHPFYCPTNRQFLVFLLLQTPILALILLLLINLLFFMFGFDSAATSGPVDRC